MNERFRPGRGGKSDEEHQGVKPGRKAGKKGGRVPPQNPHRDPEEPKKGGGKPKYFKDTGDIHSGIDEYFDSRDRTISREEVAGPVKGSESKDMIARAVPPSIYVASGDLKPATDEDKENALDPEKVHGTRVGQTQRFKTENIPRVSEVIPQRIETLEAFDSRYPQIASLQLLVNEYSKTDISEMNEWRPEFSTALRELGYQLGNEHNGIYDVEYDYGQTKVKSEMSVSQLLGMLRVALQERQKLIPREPFNYGKLTPKILEQITPSELEDIMGPDGVHKSIKRALAALGYKNAHFMLRGGEPVVEVTRSIQGKLRGTTFEIPADKLRMFLQKRIDEYHALEEKPDEKTIELPSRGKIDADAVIDNEVIDITGGTTRPQALDFHVEGSDIASAEDAERSLNDFFDPTKDNVGEDTLGHENPDPDDHVVKDSGTWDTAAGSFVNREVLDESEEAGNDFEAQVASLGLQILSHDGEYYKVQGKAPGTRPLTLSKQELLEQIESMRSGDENEIDDEIHASINIGHIDPEIAEIFGDTTYPEVVSGGNITEAVNPPRLEEEVLAKEAYQNVVGHILSGKGIPEAIHLPDDVQKLLDGIDGLSKEELINDLSFAQIKNGSSQEYIAIVTRAKELAKEGEPKLKFFDTRFESQFGISKEDLLQIEGFAKLSKEQQKLVYENFAQCVLGDVKREAERLASVMTDVEGDETVGKVERTLRAFVTSFRDGVTSSYRKFQNEKDVLAQVRTGGIQMHGEFIKQLVENVREYGPRRLHESEDGELLVDLVNLERRANGKIRGTEWMAMRDLNIAAHEFARIPANWRGQTLGTESEWKAVRFIRKHILRSDDLLHEGAYEKAENKYKEARAAFETELLKRGIYETDVQETLLDVDTRVLQLQAYNSSGGAVAELEKIEDKNFAWETFKSFSKNSGGYMALGYMVRSATVNALSYVGLTSTVFGAPVAAGAMAYLRSWNKVDAEIRERDRNAARGIKDTSEGALNVNDAEDLTEKMKHLIDRCRNASEEKKPALIAQLRSRLSYTHDKQMLGRVNYGEENGRLGRTNDLSNAIFEALTYLGIEGNLQEGSDLEKSEGRYTLSQERLQDKLKKTNEQIRSVRKGKIKEKLSFRNREMRLSVEKAVLASLVGTQISDWIHNRGVFEKTTASQGVSSRGVSEAPRMTPQREYAVPPNQIPEALIPPLSGFDATGNSELGGTLNDSARITIPTPEETPAPEVQAVVPETRTYTIKSGDTLTKILKEQIPEIKEMSSPQAREAAVVKVLSRLKPSELRAVGIESGKIDVIRAGDTIDIGKLKEMADADLGFADASVATEPSAPVSREATISPTARGESVSETIMTQEQPVRPGPVRPEFSSPTPSTESVTPRPEVTPPSNKVVELSPVREAKVVQERVIEVLKLKKDWSAVSGRFTSDLPEAVRTHSAESPALRKALKDALYAEQMLTKTLKLEERTNETVGEFMKRAAKEIAKLSPEAQNELYEKITPKGNGTFTTPEPLFRPGQIRPGSVEHGVPVAKVLEASTSPQPVEQSPVVAQSAPEAPKPVVRIGDVPPPKTSAEFNRFLINSRQIPIKSWVELRNKPDSDFVFMDIQMEDVLKDPTVSGDTKKMIFLRRLLFEETRLERKSGETLEDYFKRADDFIQGHENVKARYLKHIVGPYQEFVRGIDNASTYEIQPKQGGWRINPLRRRW